MDSVKAAPSKKQLRDQIAIAAMQQLIATSHNVPFDKDLHESYTLAKAARERGWDGFKTDSDLVSIAGILAQDAYAIADAMMEARGS